MALEPGTRIGVFEVTEQIGAGGMGEVWRATDTELKREVAIKVLPDSFAADADRLARFRREAEILASLNHPNIAQIFGLEKTGEQHVIVMELIEGPTLADRIKDGPIPPDEAMNIALQVIAALEVAHANQIVHRDLKPANVKLRDDGTVKVLDFGISKSFETAAASGSPVMTTPAVTETGIILGTAAYMSPEQARGKFVDQRTDIWAFGCLVFEMLTGQPAFAGEDVMLTLARVLDRDTDLSSIPKTLSPPVRHTLKLCLEKDPRRRIADIRDVRLAFEGAFERESAAAGSEVAPPRSARLKRTAGLVAAFVVFGAATGLGVWFVTAPGPAPVNTFDFEIPENLGFRRSGRAVLAVSPDGRRFAYNTNEGIFLRELSELDARLVAGTNYDLNNPVFSPDGQSLAFYDIGEEALKRIAISGGAAVTISDNVGFPWDMHWADDGTILLGQDDGIYRVPASGGTPVRIVAAGDGETLSSPQLLPDGDTVIFAATRSVADWDSADIAAHSLASGERTTLIRGGSDPLYVPTGHLIYALGDGLLAQAFDLASLTVSGGAVPLVQDVYRAPGTNTDSANFRVSRDGTLIFLRGNPAVSLQTLVWIDRDGRVEPINAPPREYTYAQLSPDESLVALDLRDEEDDIWIFDLARENLQRLTRDEGTNRMVVWAPDGRLIFSRSLDGEEEIYIQAADGSGVARQLSKDSQTAALPFDIHPDGSTVFYQQLANGADIWTVAVADEPQEGRPLIDSEDGEFDATISPNGDWIAYRSNESGQNEIWVRPWPDIDARRIQVSRGGGTHPLWSRDGSELYYLDLVGDSAQGTGALMAVPIEYEPEFRPGAPVELFANNFYAANVLLQVYDVASDGRFLMTQQISNQPGGRSARVIIVQNWLDELARTVPAD